MRPASFACSIRTSRGRQLSEILQKIAKLEAQSSAQKEEIMVQKEEINDLNGKELRFCNPSKPFELKSFIAPEDDRDLESEEMCFARRAERILENNNERKDRK